PLNIPADKAEGLFDRADRNRLRELQRQVDQFRAKSPVAPARAMVLTDSERPFQPYVFVRGNPGNRGEEVPRRFLQVLAGADREPFRDGSGRLELADAIADPDNPLTARVMVNRVWMHHFGEGLVGTPSDFGLRSEPPTHPELLDYLARRFMEPAGRSAAQSGGRGEQGGAWSLKKLHRLIMLSQVYQQSSDLRPELRETDPDNRLLARMNRRRLDWEATRDSLLAVAGRLDRTVGGRSVELFKEPYPTRRSLYGFIDRQNLPGVLRSFDFAIPDTHCPRRFVTTVPQQGLYLMNNAFVIEQAKALAAREEVARETDPERRITVLYRLCFGRAPDAEEMAMGRAFVAGGGSGGGSALTAWERYAQVLLLSNEFAFVD
ncbi:MAG TPA: DUF1553 domain-containing protein, partial [Gemmataceae bacterium]